MLSRMVGAALFRAETYEDIESDATAIGQAFMVVLLVTVCGILGGVIGEIISPPIVTVQVEAGAEVTGELVSGEPAMGKTATVETFNEETMEVETATGRIVAVEAVTVVGIVLAVVGGLFFGVVFWAFWVTLLLLIGGGLLRDAATQTSWAELGRMVGFAYAPRALSLFSFLPGIGWLLLAIGFVWTLAGVVVAVRHALDFESTGRAVLVVLITGVIGAIPWFIIKIVEWIVL